MTRSVRRSRYARLWLVACCVLTAVGCGAELQPPNASNQRTSGLPGDSASYRARVAQYRASGLQTRKRKAKCFLGLCNRIDVEIAALGDPSQIDPYHAPADPVAVASIHNLSTERTEKYYGIEPGGRYELWVGRKAGDTTAVWQLVGLSARGEVVAGELKDLTYCHKPPLPHDHHADFAEYVDGKCTYELPKAPVARAALSFSAEGFLSVFLSSLNAMLFDSRRDGGWIDCSNGCCT